MMSTGHAPSASSRSRGEKNTAACTDIWRPVRIFFNSIPRWKRPDEMHARGIGNFVAATIRNGMKCGSH